MIAVAFAVMVALTGSHPVLAETSEGVQVHGHWKILVLDPDGTLVSVAEFDNAFTGNHFATYTLTGGYSAGLWGIELDATVGTRPCHDGSSDFSCWIVEPVDPDTDPNSSKNLEISVFGGGFILSGSIEVDHATSIDSVRTAAGFCSGHVAPDDCLISVTAGGLSFTETVLGTPVAVDVGQIIQVTVTISFS
jgi:hypothetical protein